MDVKIGSLHFEVPTRVHDAAERLVSNPSLCVIDRTSPAVKYGVKLDLHTFLYCVSNAFVDLAIPYNLFLERLQKCLDAGLVVVEFCDKLDKSMGEVISSIVKILGANVVVKPMPLHSKTKKGIFRITGLLSIGGRLYCIATRQDSSVAYALIHPMPTSFDGQDIAQCYIVPYNGGVCYRGSLRHVGQQEILYVAGKLGKQIVTANDVKQHFDVSIENGCLQFGNGWAIGDGTPAVAKRLFRYCYLPQPVLHRLFVWYLFCRQDFEPANAERWAENRRDVSLSKIYLLGNTTATLGYVKVVFGSVEWLNSLPLKIHVNDIPIYTCDLKDILLASYNFTSQDEFNSFLREASKTPLFLRRLTGGIKVEVTMHDGRQMVELPVKQCDDGTYDIEGVRCTLDDLAYLQSQCIHHHTDIVKMCFLQKSGSLAELWCVIRKKALRQRRLAKQKAGGLLRDLLDKYGDLLKLTQIGDKKGILVKGKKHTYFVELNTGDVWRVDDSGTLANRICIVEQVLEHSYFTAYDRIISRIVALLNDDVTSQYIRTLPR